jgi:hypothetical protein
MHGFGSLHACFCPDLVRICGPGLLPGWHKACGYDSAQQALIKDFNINFGASS